MGKLIFYYGTMGSAKTANALMTRYQYQRNDRLVWLIKPATDTRDDSYGLTKIKSRIGLEAEALAIGLNENINKIYANECSILKPAVIICDEAQFFTPEQIEQLRDLSVNLDIDVLCYGLSTDFQTNLFLGAKRLFELADNLIKLDNICDCGNPALVNGRFNSDGKLITHGELVSLGSDEQYRALCWKCYRKKFLLGV